jgi:3-oxoacyl-[acyl-carrier protein] reductase
MDLGIAGKWALVCGASKGLGLGCAQALTAEGVNVVMVARGAPVLEASATAIAQASPAVKVLTVAADITTPEGRAWHGLRHRDQQRRRPATWRLPQLGP